MEARPANELPTGLEWQYEPKWDGFAVWLFVIMSVSIWSRYFPVRSDIM